MEMQDEFGQDKNLSLIGMPNESDWVLWGPYNFDLTLSSITGANEIITILFIYMDPLANEMKLNNYNGYISLESVYRPDGGSFEDGYRASLPKFKELPVEISSLKNNQGRITLKNSLV